jgi:SAM domain (Sterile alpha motif)
MSINSWGPEQVDEFLIQIGLNYNLKPRINGECLSSCSHSMLKEFGIPLVGHRLKLLNAVYQRKRQVSKKDNVVGLYQISTRRLRSRPRPSSPN